MQNRKFIHNWTVQRLKSDRPSVVVLTAPHSSPGRWFHAQVIGIADSSSGSLRGNQFNASGDNVGYEWLAGESYAYWWTGHWQWTRAALFIFYNPPRETENYHDDTGSCRFDNLRCHQWRRILHHHDNSRCSVYVCWTSDPLVRSTPG